MRHAKYEKLNHVTERELNGWLAMAPVNYVKALNDVRAKKAVAIQESVAISQNVKRFARPVVEQPHREGKIQKGSPLGVKAAS